MVIYLSNVFDYAGLVLGLLSYLWQLLSLVQSSWWRLFLTSKGSLTFAVGDGENRKAAEKEEQAC